MLDQLVFFNHLGKNILYGPSWRTRRKNEKTKTKKPKHRHPTTTTPPHKFQILLIALFTSLLTWPCYSIFICLGGYLLIENHSGSRDFTHTHIYMINIYISIKNEISKSHKTFRKFFDQFM